MSISNFLKINDHNLRRGRHASKITEEEEDEEYLKEEEDALAGAGGTRLVSQPSCSFLLTMLQLFLFSPCICNSLDS